MALVLNDRVKETTTTTGQGTISLGGAATGFETFVTGVGDTNTTYYIIVHESDGTWEIGIGTVADASPDTLARTTVIDTSAGNTTKIDFAAGSKTVFCTLPSSKAVFLDADGDVTLGANLDVGGNLTVTGTTTFNGGTLTLGDANTDNIVFGGEVDSNIIPDDDNTYDLGSSSKEWKDIYIDGTAYLDAINFDGTAITSTAAELNILDGVTASATDINLIDGITNGTVIASKAIITDSNKDITGGRNITISGELDAATLDISGDADIDGTLEADAITVNGTALSSVISGTTVSNATLAATVTVTDSTANTNFPVVFHDESNALLDDTGALRYNPSTGELLVPKLTVAGTTTTVDTVTMNAQNAVIFEGATADAHETTLTIVDPTDDRTINLPNVSGTIPVLAAVSATQITSTPEELNVLDGITAVVGELNALDLGSTAVGTAIASKAVILDSNKDYTGIRNLTITGELDGATLDISGDADIDGTLETDALSINGTAVTSTAAELNVLDGITAVVGELNALDLGSTAVGTAIASKAVILDSNKDYTGIRNLTITGELDGATLDISGNADIDGTLEADAITIGGTSTDTLYASPGFAVAMAIAL
jgi:cytoskeletal protein CcmA (bactofilin family)